MVVREIVHIGHPVLREVAQPVDPADVQKLIDDLTDTMRAANGAGLAANQIGEPVQVCVIEVRPGNPRYPYKPEIPLTVLVNPEIEVLTTETFANYEGCLSVPGLRGLVDRAVEVRVRALDRSGAEVDTVVRGLSAGTFQHETDHLRGTLFIDRVTDTRTLCTWEEFQARREAAFVERVHALVQRFGS
jgi:peptide deformylase